jgi:hypothetical protein
MSTNLSQGQGASETPKPNVRLAHGQQPVTINGVVNIGGTPTMTLPSEEEQRKGFWVSHPEVLIAQYYPRYKYAFVTQSIQGQAAVASAGVPEATEEPSDNPVVTRLTNQAESDPEFQASQSQQTGGMTQDAKTV